MSILYIFAVAALFALYWLARWYRRPLGALCAVVFRGLGERGQYMTYSPPPRVMVPGEEAVLSVTTPESFRLDQVLIPEAVAPAFLIRQIHVQNFPMLATGEPIPIDATGILIGAPMTEAGSVLRVDVSCVGLRRTLPGERLMWRLLTKLRLWLFAVTHPTKEET